MGLFKSREKITNYKGGGARMTMGSGEDLLEIISFLFSIDL